MNILKGNINFTNELLDTCKHRDDLKANETLLELMQALKQMEQKLFELISNTENGNEDVV